MLNKHLKVGWKEALTCNEEIAMGSKDKFDSAQLSLFATAREPDREPKTEWQPVRDDHNFCRLPLFCLADQKRDRFRNLKHTVTVERNGGVATIRS